VNRKRIRVTRGRSRRGFTKQTRTALEEVVIEEVVTAGHPATRGGEWSGSCGCIHSFRTGYPTPTKCPSPHCRAVVECWDLVVEWPA
jgi:hypothetical protein